MYHMASCPAKYSNNDDSLELLGHNPLKSSYDRHTSTNVSVPCFKNDTAFLFEVERNEIEGFDDDISSQLATDDSDSDTDSPYDPYDNDYDEESWVILNTPSALTMGRRFKRTSPVTESAFIAILAMNFRHCDVFDDIHYNEKRKPPKRLSRQRKVNSSTDRMSTRRKRQNTTVRVDKQ